MLFPPFCVCFSVTAVLGGNDFFRAQAAPTLRTFTAFLVAVVLTVVLPVANETLVNAEAIPAVVAGGGTEQGVGCCERRAKQITREVSRFPGSPEPSVASCVSCSSSRSSLSRIRL